MTTGDPAPCSTMLTPVSLCPSVIDQTSLYRGDPVVFSSPESSGEPSRRRDIALERHEQELEDPCERRGRRGSVYAAGSHPRCGKGQCGGISLHSSPCRTSVFRGFFVGFTCETPVGERCQPLSGTYTRSVEQYRHHEGHVETQLCVK